MFAVVHPIDTRAHPTTPPGWRWAVHLDGGTATDPSSCVNAGWEPDRQQAVVMADAVLATVLQTLRAHGIRYEYREPMVLDHDPISPAAAGLVRVL